MIKHILLTILFLSVLLTGCSNPIKEVNHPKVGLLVTETVSDQVWGTKGYKGLLKIQSKYELDVFYKEGIQSESAIKNAVEEYNEQGITLIFGHGSEYAEPFNQLAKDYPDIHFVSFNGDAKEKNTTSYKFEGYSMGFFGGMTAAHQSKSEKIGIIAAFEWQPEVEGFYEGAKFINEEIEIPILYTQDWDNDAMALQKLDELLKQGVDVVYPAGDGYNVPVIEKLKEKGLYAIGYISDQSDLGESTVLTSTVQHVERLYELIADQYIGEDLPSGNVKVDFQDGVISMGKFSPEVDGPFQQKIKEYIKKYKQEGTLPNEEETL
jgi:transcriptional activator of comK gene